MSPEGCVTYVSGRSQRPRWGLSCLRAWSEEPRSMDCELATLVLALWAASLRSPSNRLRRLVRPWPPFFPTDIRSQVAGPRSGKDKPRLKIRVSGVQPRRVAPTDARSAPEGRTKRVHLPPATNFNQRVMDDMLASVSNNSLRNPVLGQRHVRCPSIFVQ